MDTKQTNMVAMIRDTIVFLLTSNEVKGLPALEALIVRLVALMNALTSFIATQATPVGGKIADRNKVVDDAVDAAFTIIGPAVSYANRSKLGDLRKKLELTRTDVNDARLEERPPMLLQIYEAVEPVVAQLADFGVTAAQVAAFKELVDAATDAVREPRSTTVKKAAATKEIARTLREIDTLLKEELDPLLTPMEQTKPAFYARYKVARTIIDRPASRDAAGSANAAAKTAAPDVPPPATTV